MVKDNRTAEIANSFEVERVNADNQAKVSNEKPKEDNVKKVELLGLQVDPSTVQCSFCNNLLSTSQDIDKPAVENFNKVEKDGQTSVLCNDCNKRYKEQGNAFGPKYWLKKQENLIRVPA